MKDMNFLLLLAAGMGIFYLAILSFFSYFFTERMQPLRARSFYTALGIIAAALLSYVISFSYPDPEIGNRILHAFGGGFLAYFTCFLAEKELRYRMTLFQFISLSVSAVIFMGVVNEIAEYLLQNYRDLHFARDVNDTWLDLICNIIGIVIGIAVTTPFLVLERRRRVSQLP